MSAPGWQPPFCPGGPPTYAPAKPESSARPGIPSGRRPTSGARRAGMAAGVSACVFATGLAGVLVGIHIGSAPAPAAVTSTTPTSVQPSPADVRAQTIDLCTRFAAGYAALPSPQHTAADVVPAANYIGDAVRDNPVADGGVRSAVAESLRLFREHAAVLSREPARGAVQPPTNWTAAAANAADDRVWSACESYPG
jgi:hypothetical protein